MSRRSPESSPTPSSTPTPEAGRRPDDPVLDAERVLPRATLNDEMAFMDIAGTGRFKRWRGTIAWGVLFTLVAVALVWVFTRFTESLRLGVALVAFMCAAMFLIARFGYGDPGRKDF